MTDTTPRCARADRCVEAVTLDGARVGAELVAFAGLCLPCQMLTARAIGDLPADYVGLAMITGRTSGGTGEVVTSTPDLPIPVRVDVEALQRELLDEVEVWAEAVADVAGEPWDSAHALEGRTGYILGRGCPLLIKRLSVLLALHAHTYLTWSPAYATVGRAKCLGGHWTEHGGPCVEVHRRVVWHDAHREPVERDGVEAAVRFLDLHHRVRRVVGLDRPVRRMPEPCPHCAVAALTHADGADLVTCGRCGLAMTWDDYRQSTDPLADLEAAP